MALIEIDEVYLAQKNGDVPVRYVRNNQRVNTEFLIAMLDYRKITACSLKI